MGMAEGYGREIVEWMPPNLCLALFDHDFKHGYLDVPYLTMTVVSLIAWKCPSSPGIMQRRQASIYHGTIGLEHLPSPHRQTPAHYFTQTSACSINNKQSRHGIVVKTLPSHSSGT